MNFRTMKWAVVGCAVSLSAFAQGEPMGQQPGTPGRQMQMGQQNVGMPMPKDEKGFMNRLYSDNQHELQMAQLAQQKATNPQVKQYAQTLIQDHQNIDRQLTQLAQTKKIQLSKTPQATNALEKKMMDAQKTNMEILQGLSGEAFDLKFVNGMVWDHDSAIMLGTAAMQQVKDPQFQQAISQALPKFEQHRQTAYKLLGQLRPQVPQAVGGGGMQQGAPTQQRTPVMPQRK